MVTANSNHLDVVKNYANMAVFYENKRDFEIAKVCLEECLKIFSTVYEQNPNHINIARVYNSLGNLYFSKGEYDDAVLWSKKSLYIKLVACKDFFNLVEVARSHSNLANAYMRQNNFDKAIDHHRKALDARLSTYEVTPDHGGEIMNSRILLGVAHCLKYTFVAHAAIIKWCGVDWFYDFLEKTFGFKIFRMAEHDDSNDEDILIQLGNLSLLANKPDEARDFYKQINPSYGQIDFASEDFILLQYQGLNIAYMHRDLEAAVSCHLVLLKIDPELQYGNHYHRLACLYAIKGDVEEANLVFLQALERSEAAADLHAEYAQFLILNKDNPVLSDAMGTISEHLYSAITNDVMGQLSYGKLDKESVCGVLIDLINSEDLVRVNPKALAYYLLITHPEYIIAGQEAMGVLLEMFRDYCAVLSDAISATLLADAEASVASGQVVEVVEDQAEVSIADHVVEQPPTEPTTQTVLAGKAEDVTDQTS